MYGHVPWSQLVIPTIKLLEGGFEVHKSLADAIERRKEHIKNNTNTNLRYDGHMDIVLIIFTMNLTHKL